MSLFVHPVVYTCFRTLVKHVTCMCDYLQLVKNCYIYTKNVFLSNVTFKMLRVFHVVILFLPFFFFLFFLFLSFSFFLSFFVRLLSRQDATPRVAHGESENANTYPNKQFFT